MIHLLAIGCDYKGESYELPDCELDAANVTSKANRFVGDSVSLQGRQVSISSLIDEVHTIADRKADSDPLLAYFSGHGTTTTANGKTIQGIVMNDGSVFWEMELRALLAKISPAVFIADSCFSGGLARGGQRIARYVPFENLPQRPIREAASVSTSLPRYYYSACATGETAASTGSGGAFTLELLRAFDRINANTTFNSLYAAIRQRLPSKKYPQTPQFYCARKAWANLRILSFNRKWQRRTR